ncbi:MAG: hypothetical protein DMG25_13560 [Acidobacteria bacterium]|nr:MAG: hypothetical protein DMG25_13560 [Acidobacteriota bacterium]
MPNKITAERNIDNTRSTLCGIVRHSTLWLKPVLLGQFEFVEWTPDNHLRHSKFIALREDRTPSRSAEKRRLEGMSQPHCRWQWSRLMGVA